MAASSLRPPRPTTGRSGITRPSVFGREIGRAEIGVRPRNGKIVGRLERAVFLLGHERVSVAAESEQAGGEHERAHTSTVDYFFFGVSSLMNLWIAWSSSSDWSTIGFSSAVCACLSAAPSWP